MVSIVHAARDIGRIRDISRVLVRHGFGEVVGRLGIGKKSEAEQPELKESAAVRIRRVLEELGPSFVKLGQIISTRADLLPKDLIDELQKLQDSVPPVPFEQIRERVENSLGAALEDVFVSWEETPLAAASVAQVHRAVLRTDDGEQNVVLKVQRPGIAETIASDLDILHSFAALLERAIPETRIYSPSALVQQFDRAITNELDFTTEAENAKRFASSFAGDVSVIFPEVYDQTSSKRVICLSYLDGVKLNKAVENGYDGTALARIALRIITKQIFEDGFFHADPHPGNVLVLGTPEQPVFALIDLGMVGRLSPRMRDLTMDLMVAALRRDYDGIADALCGIATPSKKLDNRAFRGEVALLADRYLGKRMKDIELSSLVRDLVRAASGYGLEVPPDFLLVGKALMTIEGIGKQIAPDLDILEECRPFFFEILKRRYSPERLGTDLLRRLDRLGSMTNQMPEQLQEVLEDVRLGRLTVRTSQPELARAAAHLGRRLYSAIVLAALIVGAALLFATGQRTPGIIVASLAGVGAVVNFLGETLRRFNT